MPLFNIYLQSPLYKKSDLYLRSMSLNWINWGLVWIAQHKLFHCDQESNLLTSHQASLVREHRPPPLIGQRPLMPGPDWPRRVPGSAHCHAGQIGMNESWFEFGDKVTPATTKPNGNGKVNKWIYFLQCCFVTCSCKLAPREFLAAWK